MLREKKAAQGIHPGRFNEVAFAFFPSQSSLSKIVLLDIATARCTHMRVTMHKTMNSMLHVFAVLMVLPRSKTQFHGNV